MIPRPLRSTLFPYTTLFRSFRRKARMPSRFRGFGWVGSVILAGAQQEAWLGPKVRRSRSELEIENESGRDRKSTRLNSSHTVISYAVFCLKKKKSKILICEK